MPFLRPAALASDTATSESVVAHAVDWIERQENRNYDAIMLLEPSSPFATPAHLDEAIAMYQARKADLVVGMRPMEPPSLFVGEDSADGSIKAIVEKFSRAAGRRRQDQRPDWTMNGALYLFGWESFKATGKIYGVPDRCFGILMDRWHSIEIETPEDLAFAEFAVEKGFIDTTPWKA